jgi:hypothetical protein
MVVLADLGPAQAGEEALDLIGAGVADLVDEEVDQPVGSLAGTVDAAGPQDAHRRRDDAVGGVAGSTRGIGGGQHRIAVPKPEDGSSLQNTPPFGGMVDSGTKRNGLSKADLDVSAKLPE